MTEPYTDEEIAEADFRLPRLAKGGEMKQTKFIDAVAPPTILIVARHPLS
jgi:hypothetical protein